MKFFLAPLALLAVGAMAAVPKNEAIIVIYEDSSQTDTLCKVNPQSFTLFNGTCFNTPAAFNSYQVLSTNATATSAPHGCALLVGDTACQATLPLISGDQVAPQLNSSCQRARRAADSSTPAEIGKSLFLECA